MPTINRPAARAMTARTKPMSGLGVPSSQRLPMVEKKRGLFRPSGKKKGKPVTDKKDN